MLSDTSNEFAVVDSEEEALSNAPHAPLVDAATCFNSPRTPADPLLLSGSKATAPRRSLRSAKEQQISERLQQLQAETEKINNQLESLMTKLTVRDRENEVLRLTVAHLEERLNTDGPQATNSSAIWNCSCSQKCGLW